MGQCKLIPKVQQSKLRKQSPQWMNKAIRKSLRKNYKLHKMHKKNSTKSNKAEYGNISLAKRLLKGMFLNMQS